MSRVQVLVATMHQKDFSKLQEMNIQTDAVFANQSDTDRTDIRNDGGFTAHDNHLDTRCRHKPQYCS